MWWMIRAATGLSMSSVLLLAMIILVLGMSVGMQVGYEADSAENATVEWNGTHLSVGSNTSDQILPEDGQDLDDLNQTAEQDKDEVPKELQQVNERIESSDSEFENTSLDRFGDRFTVSQLDRLLTATSLVADSYADFFFTFRDQIPRDVARAYGVSWTLGLTGLSFKLLGGDIR